MGRYFILAAGGDPVPCDARTWAAWFEANGDARVVARTEGLPGGAYVSTVFIGCDLARGGGPPLLYETLVFGGYHDGRCVRSTTRAEALTAHEDMVRAARG